MREALALINQTLDEALAEQEGDFDADSRWALTWFEQSGFAEGEYGVAEQLSKSKNTSVAGMVEAGILDSKRGKVRLLKPEELPADWDPTTDPRLTAWEMVHQLIRALEAGGEGAAATGRQARQQRPRSPANCATASTPCASARSARPRRWPTTAWCRAGRRSCGWRAKDQLTPQTEGFSKGKDKVKPCESKRRIPEEIFTRFYEKTGSNRRLALDGQQQENTDTASERCFCWGCFPRRGTKPYEWRRSRSSCARPWAGARSICARRRT